MTPKNNPESEKGIVNRFISGAFSFFFGTDEEETPKNDTPTIVTKNPTPPTKNAGSATKQIVTNLTSALEQNPKLKVNTQNVQITPKTNVTTNTEPEKKGRQIIIKNQNFEFKQVKKKDPTDHR